MQAKQNLELKHFCSDFKQIRIVLKKLGAKKDIVKSQKDYFFDLPQEKKKQKARLKLRVENKKMSLVYYERPDFVAGKDTSADIALLEADNDTLLFLEKSLGVTAVVEKKREVWRIANTVFHLDTVKNVGGVFEIELQKEGKITKSDKKLFSHYQKELSPFLDKVIKGSNIDLVLKNKK
jgi:adenylate cyclase class IV